MLSSPKTILVVDDDQILVRLIQVNLEAVGYRVLVAYNGLNGIETAREHHPDLVILDVRMPLLNGWDVLWTLRESGETKNIPVIMLTIETEDAQITRAWREGVDCYLCKPFDVDDLLLMAERVIQGMEDDKLTAREG